MKKLYLLITLIAPFFGFSQDASKDALLDLMAKETCECVNSKKEKLVSEDKIKIETGFCIIASYTNHATEAKAVFGDILGDTKKAEKLGEDIAFRMVTVCPDVFKSLMETFADEEEAVVEEGSSEVFTPSIQGKVVEIKSGEFLTLVITDSSQRKHSLLVLTQFEGANYLIENKLKKNQSIEVKYFEQEFYDPKTKDYKYYKVLDYLEIK
ncbi:hypothetical protein [Flavobacterium sp.]|uniref:hypothetical protein n=1 Tax=Flavobacterium sp. TaxID=239 RepID=UPI0028BEA8F1|nr:hypothetical protein [Flavobacterium sp.]